MKKFTLLCLLLGGFAIGAQAQRVETRPQSSANVGMEPIRQGNWMVGGELAGLGYNFEANSFNIGLRPRAGYFVSDGFAIGAQASLGFASVKHEDNEWTYGVAPFARYYFPSGASANGRFFGHGNIGIAGSSRGDDVSLELGLAAGYAHFITQTVALEVSAGYNYNKANINSGGGQSGLGVSLGFQIYLPGQR